MAKHDKRQDAVMDVLSRPPQDPMRAADIQGIIADDNLYEDNAVQPVKGVITCLLAGVKEKPPLYERVAYGLYRLHPNQREAASDDSQSQESDTPEDSRLIQAFGMFWDRKAWEKNNSLKLMGMQPKGREFDFSDQRGVYILYDSHKIVYVGRATDQGIGERLKQHTKDRHKSRWNRFSWFGVRKLDEDEKQLIDRRNDEELPQDSIISDLEALMIEVAEPVQQRQRGKGMEVIEYLQA